jgi:phage I-like protein
VEWSPPGKELIQNKHYRFHSPHWEGKELGMEKGRMVYRPVVLLSAGLTNTPQLPVQALANEKKENQMERALLIAALGLAATATDAEITANIASLRTNAGTATTLANEKKTLGEKKPWPKPNWPMNKRRWPTRRLSMAKPKPR